MLLFALVWLHVITVILWGGGSALMAFIVGPALMHGSEASRPVIAHIAARSHPYYGANGGLVILTGLGLAFLENRFSSPLIWVVIVLAVFLAFWGARIVGTRADRLAVATEAERPAAFAALRQGGTVELIGFIVAFTIMIAVRFGY